MMFRQVWLWAAAALPAVALAGGDTFYMGDGTANDVGQAAAGKCNSAIGANYAALNSDQWNSTLNCGRCVEVSCDDSRCTDTTSTVTVYVVDKCTECEDEGLDLSPTVFKKLTGSDPSRYTLTWKFADCPASSGNNFSTLKSTGTGSGKNYQAGKVSAANESPSSVTILQANAEGVEKTSTAQQQDESESSSSPGTSPFFIALGVLAAVCAVALAAVAYSAKKKKWDEKGECVTRSFDTFSSPAQAKATIVKI